MSAQARFFTMLVSALLLFTLQVERTLAVQNDEAARALTVALNDWRVGQGLWPLQLNPTLTAMAIDQADYVLSLPDIPAGGAIHNGRSGEDVKTRARSDTYNWPFYAMPERIAVDEIAYVGRSPEAALAFWRDSFIHNRAALNNVYREVGVAALPHTFGYMYIVVLGARPNVLPAIASDTTGVLFLSNEITARAQGDWLASATHFRLFDADGRPVRPGWQVWQPSINVPTDLGDTLYVEYSDGTTQALAKVELSSKLVSGVVPSPTVTATLVPTTTASPVPPVDAPEASPTPVPAKPGDDALPPSANAVLIYDDHSLSLVNLTGVPINVQHVSFASSSVTFAVSRWQTQWLSGTLDSLAGSDCLQVWSWLEQGQLEMPADCRQRRGVITVAPEQLFWLHGEFTVLNNGQPVVMCRTDDGRCEFGVS